MTGSGRAPAGAPPRLPRLMLVTDRHATAGRPLESVLEAAIGGGVRLVLLREPDLEDGPYAALAERLRALLPEEVLLLVRDRPRLAARLGAGLHLPEAAPPPVCVTRPYGRAVHDAAAAAAASRIPAASRPDYLVAGHVFRTASKPGQPPRGRHFLWQVCRAAGPVPVFAIGGVTAENTGTCLAAGAHGVAVRSAILSSPDPRAAAARLAATVERGRRAAPSAAGGSAP